MYDEGTKLTNRPSAARRKTARNAFIVTADAKCRTGDTLKLTQFIHKIYVTLKKPNAKIVYR
jgi:hypothetical protein